MDRVVTGLLAGLAAASLAGRRSSSASGSRSRVPVGAIEKAKRYAEAYEKLSRSWLSELKARGWSDDDIRMDFSLDDRWRDLNRLFGREAWSYGRDRVVVHSSDGKYVIKLPVYPGRRSVNMAEADFWEEAGPETRKLLVPVIASDPDGAWLVMEKVEPVDAHWLWNEAPESLRAEYANLLRKAERLGLYDVHEDNVSRDLRICDYGEFVSSKGSPARHGGPATQPTMFHGTSPGGAASILRQGFRGAKKGPISTMREAIEAYEAMRSRILCEMNLDKPSDDYWDAVSDAVWNTEGELEGIGIPMPGFVYLARSYDDVQTRGEDWYGWSYVLEVDTSDTSRIFPDEDWLGKHILAYIESGADDYRRSYGEPEDMQRALGLLGEEFVAEARSMLEYAASDDWRIGSPVAKEAISGLSKTKAGRELLARFAESADTVAYRGSPRVIRVWKHGPGSNFKKVEVPELSWPELTRQLGGQKAVRRETLGRRLR